VTTETTSSISSDEDDSSWAGANFSGLGDSGALHRFADICDYLLDDSDSDDGGYELMWPKRQRVEVAHGVDTPD
jgi:hypothetical protein